MNRVISTKSVFADILYAPKSLVFTTNCRAPGCNLTTFVIVFLIIVQMPKVTPHERVFQGGKKPTKFRSKVPFVLVGAGRQKKEK